jgi:hypothetical protein
LERAGTLMGRVQGRNLSRRRGESAMTKFWAVLLILASFLFVAPVIESGTSESSTIFQSIGTAEGGGGG